MTVEMLGFPQTHHIEGRIFFAYLTANFSRHRRACAYVHPYRRSDGHLVYDIAIYDHRHDGPRKMLDAIPGLKTVSTLAMRQMFSYWCPECGFDLTWKYIYNPDFHQMVKEYRKRCKEEKGDADDSMGRGEA